MRRLLERWARRAWRREGGWRSGVDTVILGPLAGLYRMALEGRRRRDRRSAQRVQGIPVISVGNLAVGGTGKTPVSSWVVRHLASRGQRPALISRGYGRDELLLHARWTPEAIIVAHADRVAAVRDAAAQGATVAVLDDGFQHQRLVRNLDLVLLAVEDPFPGHLLPWGPYREPPSSLARAQALVVTRRTASTGAADELVLDLRSRYPAAVVAAVALEPGPWLTLDGSAAAGPEGPVLVVAAVARPDDFAANVRATVGDAVELMAFPDHHEYTLRDAEEIRHRAEGRPVVVTEKDAVKLTSFVSELPETRVLSQAVRWESGMDDVCALVDAVALDGTPC